MPITRFLMFILLLAAFSCKMTNGEAQEGHYKYTNALIHESSPYLLQHAHNPVNWNAWNDEALQKAKDENKLLLISIGYAACHWCHVMEHESFEDTTVARIMNEYFVPIKVDREERPDVDDVYMTACQLASQQGCGWPLNAFALPDGRPVWAGTYFPKKNWIEILEYFQKEWENNPDKITPPKSRAACTRRKPFRVLPAMESLPARIWTKPQKQCSNALIFSAVAAKGLQNFRCQTTTSFC
ncbi:MAG: DUF255 domain-containing protein [Saprospiraceae bacterium]